MNNEEILEDKDKALLQFYKYKEFDFKRIISLIILQIIYSGFLFKLYLNYFYRFHFCFKLGETSERYTQSW